MGDIETKRARCRQSRAYSSSSEAEYCRSFVERETTAPYRIVERSDVDIYSGAYYGSWWEVTEFEDCSEGAVFDGWFGSNYESANRCANSLNNIGAPMSYCVRLYMENFFFSDYYSVERCEAIASKWE